MSTPLRGIHSDWADFANIVKGIMRTTRREAIEDCQRVVRSHLGEAERAGVEKVLEEMRGRV